MDGRGLADRWAVAVALGRRAACDNEGPGVHTGSNAPAANGCVPAADGQSDEDYVTGCLVEPGQRKTASNRNEDDASEVQGFKKKKKNERFPLHAVPGKQKC